MCDETTIREDEAWRKQHNLTRRDFSKLTAMTALSAMLPTVANAAHVVESDIEITTPDGKADCYWVHPAKGSHAAVIVWPDIMGTRTAFRYMGKRLAQSGYAVLVVNPYYRSVKGQIMEDGKTFGDPGVREMLMPYARTLSPETCVTDGKAFVNWLDQQPQVDTQRKIGTTGYCMTGSYTIRLAAAIPERIGAAGSFHGGGLATDKTDSPHKLISKVNPTAGFLIAIAENDDAKEPETKTKLKTAFAAEKINAEIEVYKGARHGWCPLDSGVYHQAQAERAWNRLLLLFDKHLA